MRSAISWPGCHHRPMWTISIWRPMAVAVLMAAWVPATQAATIYLCKSYGGGLFWSNGQCGTRQATIERIESVPDGLPWDQQVQIGEAQWARARGASVPVLAPGGAAGIGPNPECAALDAEIVRLDAWARQPLSGPEQDRIAVRRKAARDRQFALRCR